MSPFFFFGASDSQARDCSASLRKTLFWRFCKIVYGQTVGASKIVDTRNEIENEYTNVFSMNSPSLPSAPANPPCSTPRPSPPSRTQHTSCQPAPLRTDTDTTSLRLRSCLEQENSLCHFVSSTKRPTDDAETRRRRHRARDVRLDGVRERAPAHLRCVGR